MEEARLQIFENRCDNFLETDHTYPPEIAEFNLNLFSFQLCSLDVRPVWFGPRYAIYFLIRVQICQTFWTKFICLGLFPKSHYGLQSILATPIHCRAD